MMLQDLEEALHHIQQQFDRTVQRNAELHDTVLSLQRQHLEHKKELRSQGQRHEAQVAAIRQQYNAVIMALEKEVLALHRGEIEKNAAALLASGATGGGNDFRREHLTHHNACTQVQDDTSPKRRGLVSPTCTIERETQADGVDTCHEASQTVALSFMVRQERTR